jgi:CheY-like chemotaxis protein
MTKNTSRQAFAVLVVEDDPLLLLDAVEFVEAAGFLVYEARNAAQAISMLEAHSDIRAMFTDSDMPGSMNGLKLAFLVRDRWPPLLILVTSGRHIVASVDLPTGGIFFAKPYSSSSVLRILNATADRGTVRRPVA